jgi:uncharacterized protein (TIGR03435 family)
MRAVSLVLLFCAAAGTQRATPSPTFEAASVKPAPPPTAAIRNHINTGGPGTADPGRVDWWSVSMLGFLMEAYDMKPFQISAPDWIATTKFQLTATVPKGATKEQYRLMLRNLLTERFQMKTHIEKQESDVYALVIGKNGPKLTESTENPAAMGEVGPPATAADLQRDADGFVIYPWLHEVMVTGTIYGRTRMRGNHATMEQLIARIKFMLNLPLRDETGLKGKYDFVLTYAPAPVASSPDSSTANIPEPDLPAAPDIIGAMDQIGLKLELKKETIDRLVIDHLEKLPAEN